MLNNSFRLAAGVILVAGFGHAQDSPAKLIVTVEAHGGKAAPVIQREDVVVH